MWKCAPMRMRTFLVPNLDLFSSFPVCIGLDGVDFPDLAVLTDLVDFSSFPDFSDFPNFCELSCFFSSSFILPNSEAVEMLV